ncbi:hypothetical protein [Streptomyces iakyrus]
MVRDLNGIASVFLTDLARDAAMVVREGGAKRFDTGTSVMSIEPAAPPFLKGSLRALPARRADSRTIGRDDILAATTIQLFGGSLRQRTLTEAGEAAQDTSAPG